MELVSERRGKIIVIRAMAERIDAASAIQFKERMREIIEIPSERVVFDMSKVTFLDSSGLGAVVSVMKSLGPTRKLELSGLTPTVEKVFRLTRMDSVFLIHKVLPESLRHAG
ncbi:MAG: STAS domain-containing protein [Paracoccaceae bacterium]